MKTSDSEYKVNLIKNELSRMENLTISWKKYKDYFGNIHFTSLLNRSKSKQGYINSLHEALADHEGNRDIKMTHKQYARIAFNAIVKSFTEDKPMDGDFTEDICKELLKLLDNWQGNE